MAAQTVSQYLKQTQLPQREILLEIREVALAAAPLAEEKIAWGMPTLQLAGGLIGYAAFKHHVSIFPMSASVLDQLGSSVAKFRTSKGTIQLPLDQPVPVALVRRIVKLRLKENLAKASRVPVKNGKKHGVAREFFADGQLKVTGTWRQGMKVGVWQTFDKSGRLLKSVDMDRTNG